jgi:hypothetical protein
VAVSGREFKVDIRSDDEMAAVDEDETLMTVPADLVRRCRGLALDIGMYIMYDTICSANMMFFG